MGGNCCCSHTPPNTEPLPYKGIVIDGDTINAKSQSSEVVFDNNVMERNVTPESEGKDEVQPLQRGGKKLVTKTKAEMDKINANRDRGHRVAFSAEVVSQAEVENFVKPVHSKAPQEDAWIRETIERNEKMQIICGNLKGDALTDVVNAFFQKTVKQGENVIKQGDEGDCLYICADGLLDVFVARPDSKGQLDPADKGKKVLTIGKGGLFGELALMYMSPRAATVTVTSASAKLWALDRQSFKILLQTGKTPFQMYEGWLQDVKLLKPMNHHELSQLANSIDSDLFDAGDAITSEGEPGDCFYIVEDGTCSAYMSGPGGEKEVKCYEVGDYFGEAALLTGEAHKYSVRATGDCCAVSYVSKDDFLKLFEPVMDTLRQNMLKNSPSYA